MDSEFFARTLWTFAKMQKIMVRSCCNESPRTLVPFCIFLPHLRTGRCVILIWVSTGFPVLSWSIKPYWLGALSIPGRLDAFGLSTVEELASVFETRFNVRFDFATILYSPCPCRILVAIVIGQLAELKFSEQQTELKWLMLQKWRRLFHSSREKLSFVNMSASWCVVSTFLIWIFGSNLILSNNQSSATLWVRDTCLIFGLLPLMIILITASLSSKMSSIAPILRRLHVWGNIIDIA